MADQPAASLRARKPGPSGSKLNPPPSSTSSSAVKPSTQSQAQDQNATTPTPSAASNLREPTWLDPGTWSASTRFLPAYAALLCVFIMMYAFRDTDSASSSSSTAPLDLASPAACAQTFNYSFAINAALAAMRAHAATPAAVGAAAHAALEVFDAPRAVYAQNPADVFPSGRPPRLSAFAKLSPPLLYVDQRVRFGRDGAASVHGAMLAAPREAAALGVPALMMASRRASMGFAERVAGELMGGGGGGDGGVGALDPRSASAADVAGFAPFLAYFAVEKGRAEGVREAVRAVGEWRAALLVRAGEAKGLWRAAVEDGEVWALGNALAAWGMVRTRATAAAWAASGGDGSSSSSVSFAREERELDGWIEEILDAAVRLDTDGSGLLRNYVADGSSRGEASATALLAAVAYRMAVIRPDVFAQERYLGWAHRKRRAVERCIDEDGVLQHVVDPAEPRAREEVAVSPQAQAFLVMMGTAWRDCVCADVARDVYFLEHPQPVPVNQTMPWENMAAYFREKLAYLQPPG